MHAAAVRLPALLQRNRDDRLLAFALDQQRRIVAGVLDRLLEGGDRVDLDAIDAQDYIPGAQTGLSTLATSSSTGVPAALPQASAPAAGNQPASDRQDSPA